MKIKRKRRIKKQVKVIFGLFLIIILIGGIGFMLSNNKNKVTKETKKKEDIITTNGDVSEEKKEIKSTPSNNSEFKNLEDGEYQTSKGYTLEIKNGIAYIDGNIIVNKTYSLPSDYVPSDPYEAITTDRGINNINKDVMAAFKLMQSDATSIGLNLYISSGYRGYNTQDTLYNNYVLKDGKDAADKYSARAGSSEHQSGTCFDLNTIDDSFASTDEGKWVNENAYLYGFIIRFPKGKEDETGYQYESWHLRYVGLELAKKLYNNGDWIAIEDYYGLSSVY
jgi:D-alanyl-D-alanine carboxypeptidase